MKRVVNAASSNAVVPEKMEEFLPWAIEEIVGLADYEVTEVKKFGNDYVIHTKYVGSHEKGMMPKVTLTAVSVGDDEFEFQGKFKYPDIKIDEGSYYDDVEAYTHRWYDNSKYWSRLFKQTFSRSDYIDE